MTLVDIAVALVRTTLATSLAALVAWGLLASLRVSSPRVHRVAWLLVVAQGWLLFPFTIEIESPAPLPPRRATGLVPAVVQEVEAEAIPFENETEWGRGPFATSDSPSVEAPLSQKVPDPFLLAIAVWLCGAGGIVIIAAYRYVRVLRTLPLGSLPDDPQWQSEWEAAQRNAKLRRHQTVTLRITAALGPLLHWAPWAYFILVPRPLWSSLQAAERSAILRHELAHLRRGDLWKSLAIRVLALPQWFNPFAWLAVRRFDEAAEWACDDAAARHADDRLVFANSLLQSAEYALAPYPASAPAARGVLTRRIHRLVSPRFKEESKMKLLLVPVLLLSAAVAQALRIERVVAEESPAVAAEPSSSTSDRHPGPPLSPEQMEFDRLAKEYESFARMDYIIEPPDILSIEGIKILPKAPHRLETFDLLRIHVKGALPEHPIDDSYNVDADGTVDLGPAYGRVEVVGKTTDEAGDAVLAQLSKALTDANADVSVSLLASSSAQAITGQHLVEMSGFVNLGNYGSVYVAGMTRKEARAAIESKLAKQLDAPEVSVDVLAYNSKVYFVITKGARRGDDVTRASVPFPADGKENIAKALTRVFSDEEHDLSPSELAGASITLRRPARNGTSEERVYTIGWDAATQAPTPLTNFGILPGDRLFVELTPAAALKREEAFARAHQPLPASAEPFVDYYSLLGPFPAAPPGNAAALIVPSSPIDASHRVAPGETLQVKLDHAGLSPAYKLREGDMLNLHGKNLPKPLDNGYRKVNPQGDIALDEPAERVTLAGLTLAEATQRVSDHYWPAAPQAEVRATLIEQTGLRGVNRYQVEPTGEINLHWWGKVAVAGRSLQEAREAIESHLQLYVRDPRASVEIAPECHGYVGVFVEGGGMPSYISEIPLPPSTLPSTVMTALDSAVYPRSIDFSRAHLYLMRTEGGERELAIEWDAQNQRPTAATDHALQDGDIIAVDFSATPRARAASHRKGQSVTDSTGRTVVLESRFRPNVRNPKKTATNAEKDDEGDTIESSPKPRATDDSSYRLQPFDTIKLRVERPHRPAHTLTWGGIEGEFTVDHHGAVELGRDVPAIPIAGFNVEEAQATIERELRSKSPDCKVQLKLVTPAAEKFVVSVRRADGTELAVGAHRPNFSAEADFLELSNFRSFVADLEPIRKVELERSGPHGSAELIKLSTVWQAIRLPQASVGERHVRPGDRLIIIVADECQPKYPLPWMEPCDIAGERGHQRAPRSHWSPTFNTQFDHPDVQLPAGVKYSR